LISGQSAEDFGSSEKYKKGETVQMRIDNREPVGILPESQ